jgi:biopolymer transport protein ExbD
MKIRRQLKPQVQPDLIPMIDIVFQLVVFFMVSSTFVVAPGIGLALPESSTEEQVSMDLVQVTVAKDGTLYFQDEAVDADTLAQRLATLDEGQKDRVILQGEADVPLQDVISVLDILRSRGIRNASILAKNPAPPENEESAP